LDALRSPAGKQNEVARMAMQHTEIESRPNDRQQIKVTGSDGQMFLGFFPATSNENASANSIVSGCFFFLPFGF